MFALKKNKNMENNPKLQSGKVSEKAAKKAAKENAKKRAERLKQLNKSAKQLNEERKKAQRKNAAPKSTTELIAYQQMCEDGICEVETGLFSRTIKFSDINYQTARQEEQVDLFTRYAELLNYFDSDVHVQINIVNERMDQETLKETVSTEPVGDGYDEQRKEYNSIIAANAMQGQNSIIRNRFLTFSIRSNSFTTAIPALARLESDITSHLKALGSDVGVLDGKQRVGLLHDIFRPDERNTFDYEYLVETGLTTKACIAPLSFNFREDKKYFRFGDNYGQVLFCEQLGSEINDKIISDITDLPIPMNIALHVTNWEQGQALDYVRGKIAMMEMEATNSQDKAVQKNRDTEIAVSRETRRSWEHAKFMLDQMENHNQRVFKTSLFIYTYAKDLETLQDNIFQIMAVARGKNVKLSELEYLQQEGINSIIPVGKNHVEIERTLLTNSTAAFIPFTTQELYQKNGIYYGLNALSRNLIMFDRKSLKAPNGMILGTPGSGKSFAAKREMISVLLNDPNSEVIVIDPEREYAVLAEGFNGEVIPICAGSKSHINPLDCSMNYSDEADPLDLKADFILTICELLIGGKMGLSNSARSIIGRCCRACYLPYFNNPEKESPPTLRDFYKIIKQQPEPEAKSLALDLELYIDGAMSIFSEYTNVDTTKRLIVYDLRDLGKQLRTFGMLVVLDQIWNRITENRTLGKRTWIYIDEIQLLLQNEYSANYFFELWSRARKWGAIPTGITQNVETLLLSDTARRMLSNSDFIMMLNQATSDRMELAGLLNMSNKQLSYVTSSEAGHGLLFAGKSIVPFIDNFPKDSNLYQMMTTKIEEVTAMKKQKTKEVKTE